MTTGREAAGSADDRGILRRVRSIVASHRWLFAALALAGAVAIVGLAAYMHRALSSTDPGVQNATPATLLATRTPAFPLKVGPTGRYLVGRDGRPFMIVGDSPQALIANLSRKQAARFFANREAAGFNSMWINLLCDTYTGGRANGTTYDGIAPFRKPGDLSTPNPAYFARADEMIRSAAKHHLAVFLDPIETGGWLTVLQRNGTTGAFDYGRYLGRRYRRYRNIIWLNGNDFQSWRQARDDALVLAVARGIRSADPHALQTVELNFLTSTSLDDPRWSGLVSLDAAYTYSPTYREVLKAYRNRGDHVPAFMIEASYEGEHSYTGPETLRRQEYWTMLSGATGQFYGNHYTWPFVSGWSSHLNTIGSRQMTFVTNLLSHRRWFDLVPDVKHRLVVSGYGAYSGSDDVNDSDYVTAARTPNGKLAIAYLPTGQPVVVNMAAMAGRVRAQWYDPTSGRYRTVSGSPFAPSGRRTLRVPGRNSEGADDWVLVLTAA
jgi:uncharacterized protein DUF4038/collagenase-like protein with putative collagen-binding domain